MPPGAAGREQPRRRQPGHRDLVALADGEVDDLLADHAAEQRDVGGERDDVEARCAIRDPDRVAVPDLVQRVLEADDLRNQDIDRDRQQDDGDRRSGSSRFGVCEEAGLVLRDSSAVAPRARIAARPRSPRREPAIFCLALPSGRPPHVCNRRMRPDSAREPLQPLQARVTASARGSTVRLALAHGQHQRGARDQVDDVVLAQVDEGEAEGAGVGPPERALDRPRLGQQHAPPSARRRSEARASPPTGCRRGRRTSRSQARPHCSSPTSCMIRRTSVVG